MHPCFILQAMQVAMLVAYLSFVTNMCPTYGKYHHSKRDIYVPCPVNQTMLV